MYWNYLISRLQENDRYTTRTNIRTYLKGKSLTRNHIKQLAKALEKNSCLVELDFSNCNIDDKKLVEIARIFRFNHRITHLTLSHNPIGNKGIEILVKALFMNFSLKSIALDKCSFDDKGAILLAKLFQTNFRLESMSLLGKDFDLRTVRAFEKNLKSNPICRDIQVNVPTSLVSEKEARLLNEYINRNQFHYIIYDLSSNFILAGQLAKYIQSPARTREKRQQLNQLIERSQLLISKVSKIIKGSQIYNLRMNALKIDLNKVLALVCLAHDNMELALKYFEQLPEGIGGYREIKTMIERRSMKIASVYLQPDNKRIFPTFSKLQSELERISTKEEIQGTNNKIVRRNVIRKKLSKIAQRKIRKVNKQFIRDFIYCYKKRYENEILKNPFSHMLKLIKRHENQNDAFLLTRSLIEEFIETTPNSRTATVVNDMRRLKTVRMLKRHKDIIHYDTFVRAYQNNFSKFFLKRNPKSKRWHSIKKRADKNMENVLTYAENKPYSRTAEVLVDMTNNIELQQF